MSPGLRRGGWLNTVQKTLTCTTVGTKIPPFISANVARLEIGDKIFFQVRTLAACGKTEPKPHARLHRTRSNGMGLRSEMGLLG